MKWVVFLRGVNVGGANRCQPAAIAKQLAKFGVVNIGAVGTFVVRENVSESVLRNAIAKKLPFKCEIMICPARDIIKLASKDPFSRQPAGSNITRFVNVLAKRIPSPPPLPPCAEGEAGLGKILPESKQSKILSVSSNKQGEPCLQGCHRGASD